MRSYWRSILAGSLLAALSAAGAFAFPAETIETTVLLQGPADEFEPIVELPPGTEVEVLNCDANWCEVSVGDYDGFVPRAALDLLGYTPPRYAFPPLLALPDRWHGRYYSREHFRYESRARWRDREGRRRFVVPPRVLEPRRELRRLTPRDGPPPQFRQKQIEKKGPPPSRIVPPPPPPQRTLPPPPPPQRTLPPPPPPKRVTPPPPPPQRVTPPPPPPARTAPAPPKGPPPKGPPPKKGEPTGR
jgi:hypothetical protein